MKLIEALKALKAFEQKIQDLDGKIRANSAVMDYQELPYEDPKKQVLSWIDARTGCVKEYSTLSRRIARTNLETDVTIIIESKERTASIFEWILRRRKLNSMDRSLWLHLGDNGLKATPVRQEGKDEPVIAKVVRHYDVERRDRNVDFLNAEPLKIDAALEIVNATTDLLD